MVAPPTFEEFEPVTRRPSVRERAAEVDIRRGTASASREEAAAAVAPELTRAQLRTQQLQAEKLEADLRKEEEEKAAAVGKQAAMADKAVAEREQALLLLEMIQKARDAVSNPAATGIAAQLTGGVFGTPSKDLEAALQPIRSDVVLDAMAKARIGSAAGATGFGALDRGERDMLASSLGALAADQSPEQLLSSLDNIDRTVRASLARGAGYDPNTPEGAALFGLPQPAGTEDLPLPSSGDVTSGRWEKRPELAGIDAAVTSMIKAGRSPAQIRQYLNEYQPGLGDKAQNIEANIDYFKKTGEDPGVTIERYFVQEEPGLAETITDNPLGAGAQAFANEMSLGLTGLIPGEEGQRIRAVQRGLADQYPNATTIGGVAGGVGSGLLGVGAAGKLGKLPGLLEGVGQETIRGAAQAEPGERLAGGAIGAGTALGGNVLLKPVANVVGGALRGATPDAATLSQKYGVTLSPGQLAGADERTAAGLPLVGGQVQARRNESLAEFNQAAFNEVLRPIGATVDTVGQKGVAQAQNAVSKAYDKALGGRAFQIDAPFVGVVQGAPYATLKAMKGEQGPKAAAEIDRILSEVNNNGVIDGRAWQQARRQLVDLQGAGEIKDAIGGAAIVDSVGDVIDAFDGLVQRQAPDVFDDYMAANTAYRGVKVLERAVDFARDGDVFGPGNLRAATRQNTAKFGGSAASARGDRPLNELVMAGLNIIPERTDDVSLAGRLFSPVAGAGAGLGGAQLITASGDEKKDEGPSYLPPELLAIAAGAGLASLPYSRAGTRAANRLLGGQRTDTQQMLGDMISKYAPAALRGGFAAETTEPGAPMPQEPVSPRLAISPEMRAALLGAPVAPAEEEPSAPFGGFTPEYEEPAGTGQSTVVIDGRVADIDPVTGKMIYVDTGEEVPGFKRGGQAKAPTFGDRARSVAKGATFAFNDEIEGGLRALMQLDPAAYEREVARIRAQQRAYEEANPIESLSLEVGGSFLPALIPGGQGATAARLAALSARYPVRAGLARAAGEGALYGVGAADSMREVPRSVAEETAFGAGMYGLTGLAAKYGKKGYQRVRGKR